MAWRKQGALAVGILLWSLSGCASRTGAALVPRLVVHVTAADRQSQREDAAAPLVRHSRWDVAVHAALRWRPALSSSPPFWPPR